MYILYIDIEYPPIVNAFFNYFAVFDLKFIPGIIDNENRYFMKAPKGFHNQKIDSLFLRNSGQYIVIFYSLIALYIISTLIGKLINFIF